MDGPMDSTSGDMQSGIRQAHCAASIYTLQRRASSLSSILQIVFVMTLMVQLPSSSGWLSDHIETTTACAST